MADSEQRLELTRELRARIDEIDGGYHALAERNYNAILRNARQTRWLLYVLTAMMLVLGVLSVFFAKQGSDLAKRIQASRVEQCQLGNQAHRNTLRKLDQLIAAAPPAQRRQLEPSRNFTIALIDAITPIRDCSLSPPRARRRGALRAIR